MTWLEATVLGIVQGLTEFLPISSTAHLRIVPALAGWSSDPGAAFTAIVQLGTLVAVFLYFWPEVVRLFRGFWSDCTSFRYGTSADAILAWKIAVGTIPVVVAGLVLKEKIENEFRDLRVIAWSLIGFSILLALAEWRSSRSKSSGTLSEIETTLSWKEAILIGLFQALALVPGASRSGVTITAGLLIGMSRPSAARFSFLLSMPAILGAGLYQMVKHRKDIFASTDALMPILLATVVAGIVGYASIAFLLGFLKRYSTYSFVVYRILLGFVILVLVAQGIVKSVEPVSE